MKDQQFSGTAQLLKTIQKKSETFQNYNRTTTGTDLQHSKSCFDRQLHGDSSWSFPLWTKLRQQLQHAGHRDRRERHHSTPDVVIKPRPDRSHLLMLSIQSLRRTRSPSLTGSCRSSVSVMTSMWGRDSTGLRSYRWTWVSYVINPTRTSDKAPPSSLREGPE